MNANTSLKQAIRQIYIAGIFSWKIEPVPGYGPVIRSSWSGGCFRVQRVPQDHRPEIIVPQEFHPAAILIAANPFERGKEARKRAAELACRENIHEEIRYTITERGEDYRFPAPLYRVSFPPFERDRYSLCSFHRSIIQCILGEYRSFGIWYIYF